MRLVEGAYGIGGKVLFFNLGKHLICVCVLHLLYLYNSNFI